MPTLNPMNSADPAARAQLAQMLAGLDPSVLDPLRSYWQSQSDPYAAWTNLTNRDNTIQASRDENGRLSPIYTGETYSPVNLGAFDWLYDPANVWSGESEIPGSYQYDQSFNPAIGDTGANGLDYVPLEYVKRNEAEYKARDPSFDINKLETIQHPVMGPVVLNQDLPQFDQTTGEMFGEMMSAAAMVAAGAMSISAFAGQFGMPGLQSLLDITAAPTTGADSLLADQIAAEIANLTGGPGGAIGGTTTTGGTTGTNIGSTTTYDPGSIEEISNLTGGPGYDYPTLPNTAIPNTNTTPINPTDTGYPSEWPTDPTLPTTPTTPTIPPAPPGTDISGTSTGGPLPPSEVVPGTGTTINPTTIPQWIQDLATSMGINPSTLMGLVGAGIGGLGGAFNGAQEAGTTTVTRAPWAPMAPYLLDAAERSQNFANTPAMNEQERGIVNTANSYYSGQINNPMINNIRSYSENIIDPSGKINSPFGDISNVSAQVLQAALMAGVDPIQAAQMAGVDPIQAAQMAGVDPIQAAQMMGSAADYSGTQSRMGGGNPDQALKDLLAGRVDNPYLDQQAQSMSDLMTRNMMETIMPGINTGANAAGQFGGSRQGIAQGLATSRLNQDMSKAMADLYGNAYEQAQQRKYGTANSQASIAAQLANADAGRFTTASQTNAQLEQEAAIRNAANMLNTQQWNAGAQNDMSRFNATNALNTQQWNAGAQNDMSRFNATNALNTQQWNAGALNNMNQFNATNDLTAQRFNADMNLNENRLALDAADRSVNWANTANTMQNQNIQSALDTANYEQEQLRQQVNDLVAQMSRLGGMGGSTETPYYTNPAASIGGGIVSGWNAGANAFGAPPPPPASVSAAPTPRPPASSIPIPATAVGTSLASIRPVNPTPTTSTVRTGTPLAPSRFAPTAQVNKKKKLTVTTTR